MNKENEKNMKNNADDALDALIVKALREKEAADEEEAGEEALSPEDRAALYSLGPDLANKIAGEQTGYNDYAGIKERHVERDIKLFGNKRFWKIAGMAACLVFAVLSIYSLIIFNREAESQETYVYGQWNVSPGMPASYRVIVVNGKSGSPIEGADVSLVLADAQNNVVWSDDLKTGEYGIVHAVVRLPEGSEEGEYKLSVKTGSSEGSNKVAHSINVSRAARVLITADKPLYQPGQTIHMRVLSLSTGDNRPVAGKTALIEVKDPKGNKVFGKSVKTSEFGIAAADFELADQVNLGDYAISATVDEAVSERSVNVMNYTLPKFKIDVNTDKTFYAPGETLKGDVSAQYTFGEPVSGGKVSIKMSDYAERGKAFATETGTLDESGAFSFTIPLKDNFYGVEVKKGDAIAFLDIEITDKAGHTRKLQREITVAKTPIRIDLFPESGKLVKGVENHLFILTTYADGRPAKTKLTIGASSEAVETSELGIAKVRIIPESNDMQLTVAAEDKGGLKVRQSVTLDIDWNSNAFLLRTDKAVYNQGETAEITVLSRHNSRVFIDVIKEQNTVLMKALDVEEGSAELALDIPPDLFGTLQIHAYRLLPGGQMVSDTRVIQVRYSDGLKIKAELDKTTYRPAEKALIKFLVTRKNGDPAQAALGLAGVDEAVFALAEMQPGLERIYFTVQEELIKPKYEIHDRAMPVAIREAVEPDRQPTRELEEASVILFSASDSEPHAPQKLGSQTYDERLFRIERDKEELAKSMANFISYLLVGIFLLMFFVLVVLIFRMPGNFSLPEKIDAEELENAIAYKYAMMIIWFLGVVIPSIFIMAFNGPVIIFAGLVIVAGSLITYFAVKMRKLTLLDKRPVLRKFLVLLPVAYILGMIAIVLPIIFAEKYHVFSGDTDGRRIFIVIFMLFTMPLISLACRLTRKTHKSILPALAVVAAILLLLAGIILPSLFSARYSMNRLMLGKADYKEAGKSEGEKKAEDKSAVKLPTLDFGYEEIEDSPKTVPAGGEMKSPKRVRRYFPETLFWQPQLITDSEGRAQMDIALADSITTWRVSMNAVSKEGELGAGSAGIRVFQDFFIDIDFPTALTQNDAVEVPVAVFNYLGKPQKVRLEVVPADWYELDGGTERMLEIAAKDVTGISLRIKAIKPGYHTLTVKAHGSEMADAVERRVKVKPDGEEIVEVVNGTLDKKVAHMLTIPSGSIDGADDLLLKFYPGAFSQVVEGLDNIFRMPYGCFEQTSSTVYPNIMVLDYMRGTKQIKPDIELKALSYINQGYQRLLTFEVKGGGFSLYGDAPAALLLTAYGLMEFEDMSRVFEIDRAVIERTRAWLLRRQSSNGSWNSRDYGDEYSNLGQTAFIAWALARSGEMDGALSNALDYIKENSVKEKDSYILALCANALLAANRDANDILKRLEDMRIEKDKMAYWRSSGRGVFYSYGGTMDVETTALVVYAFMKARRFAAVSLKGLNWLVSKKGAYGTWGSTQSTVCALRALLEGSRGKLGSIVDDLELSVSVNGREAKKIAITSDDWDVFRLISLREFVRKGENEIKLAISGGSNFDYQIVATHYLPWAGKPAPEDKEMSIDIAYNTTELKTEDVLSADVTIRYNRPGTAMMTIVDLGIPPGFDVMTDSFDELKEKGVIERYSVAGRQVILYFRSIESGKPVEFTYKMKAKYPLRVKTPVSTVYQYYEPDLRDETKPVTLTVTKD